MRKLILLILFSLILVSCTKKEKTYEALEAEVLCDVLPEIAKYELNQNFLFSSCYFFQDYFLLKMLNQTL
jgi:uncharacterized protein YcfL